MGDSASPAPQPGGTPAGVGNEAAGAGSGPAARHAHHRRFRYSAWLAAALALLTLGAAGSLFGALLIAHASGSSSRQNLRSSARQIAATLQLAIQHEDDLIVSASGFLVNDPTASSAAFHAWARSIDALGRYPEMLGIAHSAPVSAAELPGLLALLEKAQAHSVTPGAASGAARGAKPPAYCVSASAVYRSGMEAMFAPRQNLCKLGATAWSAGLAALDSGQPVYAPWVPGGRTLGPLLVVFAPIYQGLGGSVTAGQRAGFTGWVAMVVRPGVVLASALRGHPHTAVIFRYRRGGASVDLRSGAAPRGAATAIVDLKDGWTVVTRSTVVGASVFADAQAITVLVAGLALSVLIAALIFVLATGRARATRLVALRTDELRHLALHDALTGLANRALLSDRILQMLARNRRLGRAGAALYVDIDDFKNINDTLGHDGGDRLLQGVATRLTSTLRAADTAARIGGDEFVVLIDDAKGVAPDAVARRLLALIAGPFDLGAALPLSVTASIGVAVGDRETPADLLRDADVALYEAKAAGKNRYAMFDPSIEHEHQRRTRLEFDLRSALERDQYRLVYQPIYTVADLSLVGVEALVRWEHPTLGTVAPGEFIPLLEASGQMIDVGRWILRRSCAQTAEWRSRGAGIGLSVNISGRQFESDALVSDVRDALASSGLDPAALTIEITETALMNDTQNSARRMAAIKGLGVSVAIDDFGTGYSSLAYLQQFPVDCLKIDGAFTQSIADSTESDTLVHMLVQLGRDLGLSTLAEGVETTEQLDHVRREGVDQVQGFLLARPLAPATLEAQVLLLAHDDAQVVIESAQ
jgi:diguanylate cyclase (GGDEF)-like protein